MFDDYFWRLKTMKLLKYILFCMIVVMLFACSNDQKKDTPAKSTVKKECNFNALGGSWVFHPETDRDKKTAETFGTIKIQFDVDKKMLNVFFGDKQDKYAVEYKCMDGRILIVKYGEAEKIFIDYESDDKIRMSSSVMRKGDKPQLFVKE